MSTKRLTNHNGRKGKDGVYSAKHNDRNYDVKHSKNVDPAKTVNNRTWHIYPEENLTFEEAEKKFYEENFASYLEQKNDRYINGRHPERVQTMDEFRKNERTCPEEVIMQIGNVDDGGLDPDELIKICREQIEWESENFPNVKLLDIALHTDEDASPHIHVRKVWVATDEHGSLQVNQTKALEAMGIERPDISKKKDRNNNAKMVYSKLIREHFIEVCKSHGIEIEEVPKEASETGLSLIEFKYRKEKEKLEAAVKKLSEISENLETAIKERDKAVEEKEQIEVDTKIKVEQLSDVVNEYLNVKKKKKVIKEDTFEMSKTEYEKFEADKLKMAENAQIILEAQNIGQKREEVTELRKEYSELLKLKKAEEAEHTILARELPKLREEKEKLKTYIEKNIPEKIKTIEQRDRLSLLESIVADAGRALKALDKFLDEHTNIKYHSIIRKMVRGIADILSKADASKQENTRDINRER